MFARHVSMQLKPNTRAEFTLTIENEQRCFRDVGA